MFGSLCSVMVPGPYANNFSGSENIVVLGLYHTCAGGPRIHAAFGVFLLEYCCMPFTWRKTL